LALGLLFVAVAVFVLINYGDTELRRALAENREFQIRIDGEAVATVGVDDLLDLQPQEFSTKMATSIGAPRQVTLEGVELRSLLDAFGVDATQAAVVVISGFDGYHSPLKPSDIYKTESVYICSAMNGKILKAQSEGGLGPFLMVVRSDRFAQRWCKYVEAVDIRR
jgi:DMSO/TMAO reductase YedYZ molybdopterin-dependent catalytic subunit